MVLKTTVTTLGKKGEEIHFNKTILEVLFEKGWCGLLRAEISPYEMHVKIDKKYKIIKTIRQPDTTQIKTIREELDKVEADESIVRDEYCFTVYNTLSISYQFKDVDKRDLLDAIHELFQSMEL